jgi:hypothetical protein
MGNRIASVLTGIVYARLTGRRLLVDWNDLTYSRKGVNSFHEFFASPDVDPLEKVPPGLSVTPSVWQGKPRVSVSRLIREVDPGFQRRKEYKQIFSADLSRIDHAEDIAVIYGFRFDWKDLRKNFARAPRAWRSLDKLSFMRQLLGHNLFLRPYIRERIDAFKARFFNVPVIGVHIRYTDNTVHRERTPTMERFPVVIDRLLQKHPGSRIVLATDNKGIREEYKRRYGNVVWTEKWHPPNGSERLHSHGDCPDRLQNGIEALVDMHLLAESDRFVYSSTSTFARLVRLMIPPDASRIYNIERWRITREKLGL